MISRALFLKKSQMSSFSLCSFPKSNFLVSRSYDLKSLLKHSTFISVAVDVKTLCRYFFFTFYWIFLHMIYFHHIFLHPPTSSPVKDISLISVASIILISNQTMHFLNRSGAKLTAKVKLVLDFYFPHSQM